MPNDFVGSEVNQTTCVHNKQTYSDVSVFTHILLGLDNIGKRTTIETLLDKHYSPNRIEYRCECGPDVGVRTNERTRQERY